MIDRNVKSDGWSMTSLQLESTNPLRGLTLIRAIMLMEQFMRGEYADVQWTMYHVIQSDPDLFALISRRSSALCKLDWTIKSIDDLKPEQEQLSADQAAALRKVYERVTNLNQAIEDMAQAFAIGFSIAQMEPDPLMPTLLGQYKPWNILREGIDGAYFYNPKAQNRSRQSLSELAKIEPSSHIIYTPRFNVLRIALTKFVRSNLSNKDWAAFVEQYGIPAPFITLPPSVPNDQEQAYLAAAEALHNGNDGVLPYGSSVTFPSVSTGVPQFEAHLKYLQEQLILAGTGGLLTMLTESGSGTLAGSAHSDTFDTIAKSEAKHISEIFQTQLDKPTLARLFPEMPVLSYFSLLADEEQDVGAIIQHASTLAAAGYQIDAAELAEKTGYTLTKTEAPVISPPLSASSIPPRVFNRAPVTRLVCINRELSAEAPDTMKLASEADFKDVKQQINDALAIEDPAQMEAALLAIKSSLPDVLSSMLTRPSQLAETLYADMIEAADSALKQRKAADKSQIEESK